ncbi:AraC family transcriptional regulator [Propionivibrio limicola]|uniref:AraC family transcriptional regulator n=1 Tax=Propionivibrio limicola TaxID=167645 RepID=UPI0012924555|nr:helix-turn-helix transcriptional regulator [Propionivibrio limicola]
MTIDIADTPSFLPSHAAFIVDPEQPVLSDGRDLEAHARVEPHSHPRGQLLWAAEGVLRVASDVSVWIVPPSHAVWIAGGVLHHVVTETPARIRNLYVDPFFPIRDGDGNGAMLLLTPLMREIILRLTEESSSVDVDSRRRLSLVAIDEIRQLESAPLCLPAGKDARLRRLTGFMIRNPGEQRALNELAKIAGSSLRTMERLCKAETGMTFRQWRSHLRLLNAIERLGQGESSTTIAHSLGFRSVSSFVAAFRQKFGCPPQKFLK